MLILILLKIFPYPNVKLHAIFEVRENLERGEMKQPLDFKEEGMIAVHIFPENLAFPVVIATCSTWEQQQIAYLKFNFLSKKFTTSSLCQ